MISQARLKELFRYSKGSGLFKRRVSVSSNTQAGDLAGCLNRSGYVVIRIDGTLYYAHRLAWLYVYGFFPPEQVDHRNGIRWDNSFRNLRLATNQDNCHNIREPKRGNPSGLLGVSWHAGAKKWLARIKLNDKVHYLGVYEDKHEAYLIYLAAKKALHPFQMLS